MGNGSSSEKTSPRSPTDSLLSNVENELREEEMGKKANNGDSCGENKENSDPQPVIKVSDNDSWADTTSQASQDIRMTLSSKTKTDDIDDIDAVITDIDRELLSVKHADEKDTKERQPGNKSKHVEASLLTPAELAMVEEQILTEYEQGPSKAAGVSGQATIPELVATEVSRKVSYNDSEEELLKEIEAV